MKTTKQITKIIENYERTIQPAINKAVKNIKDESYKFRITIFMDTNTGEVSVSDLLSSKTRVIFDSNRLVKLIDIFTWYGSKKVERKIQEEVEYKIKYKFDFWIENINDYRQINMVKQ